MPKGRILLFFLGWVAFSFLLGHNRVMYKRPQSMHQWAQCDRASIALNYAEESMDFFKPRVHAVMNGTGITGLEFPLMNYMAALCYKAFGYHDGWYRFLMFLVVTLGVYSAWRLSCAVLKSTLYGSMVTLVWASSPVLNYYTPNFVPDAASLGLMMCAWWMLYRTQVYGQKYYLIPFFIAAALACLIKVTSLVGLCVIIGMLVLEWLPFYRRWQTRFRFRFKAALWIAIAAAIGLTIGWYKYAGWLSNKYHAGYFLLGLKPPESIADFFKQIHDVYCIWREAYYSKHYAILLGIFLLLFMIRYRQPDRRFMVFVLLYLAGGIGFFTLMIHQFRDHDYYALTLLPIQFFMILWIGYELRAGKVLIKPLLRYTAFGLVGAYMVYGVIHTVRHQGLRYTEGNFFSQQVLPPHQYTEAGKLAKKLGITRDHIVITMNDISPNVSLYLMDLKGWPFFKETTDANIEWAMKENPAQYLVTNDTAVFSRPVLAPYRDNLLGETEGVGIYSLDSNFIQER